MAAKSLMAQPQQLRPQHHQLPYTLPPIVLNQPSAASFAAHPITPYTTMEAFSAATARAKQYPQAVAPLSHDNPQLGVTTKASHSNNDEVTPLPACPLPSQCGKRTKKERRPPKKRRVGSSSPVVETSTLKSVMSSWEDKKEAKKAANRLSAHQSRKRKKEFMHTLQDKNRELRRMEQILQSIPDLIIVFDSSGHMPFVSHSVNTFLESTSDELEGTSFWDILTLDSIQLVKSAFMDALAVKRKLEDDSTLLWEGGSMTVKLVEKHSEDGNVKLVSLKGVVHFLDESPECVCSIRPEEDYCEQKDTIYSSYENIFPSPGARQVSLSDIITTKQDANDQRAR